MQRCRWGFGGPCLERWAACTPRLDWAPRFVRGKSTFQSLARNSVEAYLHSVSIFRDDMRAMLFTPEFKRKLAGYRAAEVFHGHAQRAGTDDPLSLIQYIDMQTYLVGDINTKVDRASMAHSLEVREPLMDHPLVEWVASLPSHLKLRRGEGKWLLKKTLEPHLPDSVLYRPKMGFAVPLARWFRGPLRERVRSALLDGELGRTGIFERSYLEHLVDAHAVRAPRVQRAAVVADDVRGVPAQRRASRGGRCVAPVGCDRT